MGRGPDFTKDEDLIIITCRDYGLPFEKIQQKLALRGYNRSKSAVVYRYRFLKQKERETKKSQIKLG